MAGIGYKWPRVPFAQRAEKYIERIPFHSCWEWSGAIDSGGYGVTNENGKKLCAHRAVFELERGPIPEGLEIDHLCRNRSCVRPDHMEAVTTRENTLRGTSPPARQARMTHCKYGHEFNSSNTRVYKNGRCCRTCDRIRARKLSSAITDSVEDGG